MDAGGACSEMIENGLILGIGVVGSELRDKQWSKILSLASMHV